MSNSATNTIVNNNNNNNQCVANSTSFNIHYMWLSRTWDKTMDSLFELSQTSSSSQPSKRDPCVKIPQLFIQYLCGKYNNRTLVTKLERLWTKHRTKQIYDVDFQKQEKGNTTSSSTSIWFYDQRRHNEQPKSQQDVERIFNFVDFIISHFFQHDTEIQFYLTSHMKITCCFVVWLFSRSSLLIPNKPLPSPPQSQSINKRQIPRK